MILYGAQIASVFAKVAKVFNVHSYYLVYPGCLLLLLQANLVQFVASATSLVSIANVFGAARTVYESNTGF